MSRTHNANDLGSKAQVIRVEGGVLSHDIGKGCRET